MAGWIQMGLSPDTAAHRFFHLTSWCAEVTPPGTAAATSWDRSNYWLKKRDIETVTEPLSIPLPVTDERGQPYNIMKELKYRAELLKEFIFEEVRCRHENLPSRWRCMFLIPKSMDPWEYGSHWNIIPQAGKSVVEIEIDTARDYRLLPTDMRKLNCNLRPYQEIEARAEEYWKGTSVMDINTEWLFEGAFTILRYVPQAG